MATIPRPRLNTRIASGSVGRQRINAPVEAFGSGAGMQAIGGAVASLGSNVQEYAVKQKKRDDDSDIMQFRAKLNANYDQALIKAKRATTRQEHDAIWAEANANAEALSKNSGRSKEAQDAIRSMFMAEQTSRTTQSMITGLAVNDRETDAQNIKTRTELTTTSPDQKTLEQNKALLKTSNELYQRMTPAERENAVKADLRAADNNFAKKLYDGIFTDPDGTKGAFQMRSELEAYSAFIENSEDLNDQDKSDARQRITNANKRIVGIEEGEYAQAAIDTIMPADQPIRDELRSPVGQADAREMVQEWTDKHPFADEEQRERVKSKIFNMMDSRFQQYNAQRVEDLNKQLSNPSTDFLGLMIDSVAVNPDMYSQAEKDAIQKIWETRVDVQKVNSIGSSLPDAIAIFDVNSATTEERIAMNRLIATQPAYAQSVYKQILQDNKEMDDKGALYKDRFSQLKRLLIRRWKLDSDNLTKDKKTERAGVVEWGLDRKLSPEDRISGYADDLHQLRMIAEREGMTDAQFDIEAEAYLKKQSEKTSLEIKKDKVKRLSK